MEADVIGLTHHIVGTTRMQTGERQYLLSQVEELERWRRLAVQAIEYGMRQERRSGDLYHALGEMAHRTRSCHELQDMAKHILLAYRASQKQDPVSFERVKQEAGY
jgi:hypothetical protein